MRAKAWSWPVAHTARGTFDWKRAVEKYVIDSSVWTSLGTTSLLYFSAHAQLLTVPWSSYLLGFSSTLAVYTVDRMNDAKVERKQREVAEGYYDYYARPLAKVVAGVALLVSISSIAIAPRPALALCSFGVFGLIYGLPLPLEIRGKRPRLKEIPFAKAILVGTAIAFAAALAPPAYSSSALTAKSFLVAVVLSLNVVANAMMCDVRDLGADRQNGLRTLPVLFGERCVRLAAVTLNLLAAVMLILNWSALPTAISTGGLFAVAFSAVCVSFAGQRQSRLVFNLMVDGSLVLFFLIPSMLGGCF